MTIEYSGAYDSWRIERHQDGKLFYCTHDTAMGGQLMRYEIEEVDLEFVLKEKPTGPEFELYLYKKWGRTIKVEKYYDDIKKWVVMK